MCLKKGNQSSSHTPYQFKLIKFGDEYVDHFYLLTQKRQVCVYVGHQTLQQISNINANLCEADKAILF